MVSCSRTSSQRQRPTPPPHLDRRGRSGRTPLLVHLQLRLEALWVQRYSTTFNTLCKWFIKILRFARPQVQISLSVRVWSAQICLHMLSGAGACIRERDFICFRQNSQFDPSTFTSGSNSSLNYEIDRFHPQTFYLSSISSLVLCDMPTWHAKSTIGE